VTLQVPGPGQYFIAYFEDDGYFELTERIAVFVLSEPRLVLDKAGYSPGEQIGVHYSGAPALTNDWIGIYKQGELPGEIPSTLWSYTSGQSGDLLFDGLEEGYYFTAYFLNNGYTEAGERVVFSVGSELATLQSASEVYQEGEPVVIHYQNGPGLPADWIGIFRKNAPPGTAPLLDRQFTNGPSAGSVDFTSRFLSGHYYAAMYINNSSVRISGEAVFSVEEIQTGTGKEDTDDMLIIYSGETPGRVTLFASPPPGPSSTFRISSLTGLVVYEERFSSRDVFPREINLAGLATGMYLAVLSCEERIITRKFILN